MQNLPLQLPKNFKFLRVHPWKPKERLLRIMKEYLSFKQCPHKKPLFILWQNPEYRVKILKPNGTNLNRADLINQIIYAHLQCLNMIGDDYLDLLKDGNHPNDLIIDMEEFVLSLVPKEKII